MPFMGLLTLPLTPLTASGYKVVWSSSGRSAAPTARTVRHLIPAVRALMKRHRHDEPQLGPFRIVAAVSLPDAAAISQEPQAHPWIELGIPGFG